MFEETASWLQEDRENALTLIVDELHSYRGTQGSEVAMIIRKLCRRLDLPYDSPQLRCIGTSASLEATARPDCGVRSEVFWRATRHFLHA